jgi:hypothetical protein
MTMTRCSPILALAVLLGSGVLAAACGNSGGFPSTGPSPLPSSGGAIPTPSQPTPTATPFAALDGSYQMTIVADGCQDSFPNAYRTRTYAARVDQKRADVTFVLAGVPLVAGATESPRLWGVMGSEHLTLTTYLGSDSDPTSLRELYFPLYEQVEPTRLLNILVDNMTLTGSADTLSGTFAGAFLLYEGSAAVGWSLIVTTCESKNHGVTFTRSKGSSQRLPDIAR